MRRSPSPSYNPPTDDEHMYEILDGLTSLIEVSNRSFVGVPKEMCGGKTCAPTPFQRQCVEVKLAVFLGFPITADFESGGAVWGWGIDCSGENRKLPH